MLLGRTKFAVFFLVFALACTVPQLQARKKDATASIPNDQKRALHALNRLTFGPRPGDVQQVLAIGVDRWIDLQLHPGKIDDSAINSRLEPFRTLRMNSREIAEDFPDPQIINQVMNGKRPMPSDPALHAVYEVQVEKLKARKERKEKDESQAANASTTPLKSGTENSQNTMAASAAASEPMDRSSIAASASSDSAGANVAASLPPPKPDSEDVEQGRQREDRLYADLDVQQLPSLPPDQRYQKILAMPVDQLGILAENLRGGNRLDFLQGMTPRQKETVYSLNYPPAVVDGELAQAKLLRAVYSQRQLDEVMTDFWFNHFNVFVGKGLDRMMLTSYERDVIRPHALGKFEDLLVATAKSPAMLFYLDNWLSVGPDSPQALGIPAHPNARPHPGKRPSGLNENYGRELLELHTLSVNGGYSQRDVTEVAKVFTGWTIDKPAQGGGFKFDERMHQPGPKFVFGHRIKPKGEQEGLEVLHRLATSPQTAHFISLKLAQRFVSDDPPPALVDRMATIFLKKKGDIREVLTVLFHSPEFWDDATYRAKVKTPLEFVASSIRATGADIDDALPLTQQLNRMGMPLYGAQPPTGYSMKAETWVSSSALLNRMNFALALTSGKIRGVKLDLIALSSDHASSGPASSNAASSDRVATLSEMENILVAGGVSQQTHDSIAAQLEPAKTSTPSLIAGLLLGSPEFQRR